MTERNIFCASKVSNDDNSFQQERFRAFNKVVGEERYFQIVNIIKKILKDFEMNPKENWTKEWEKVTTQQWRELSEIPEFDIDVVKMIIGFKPEITDIQEMTLSEVCKELGKEIKIKK